MVAAEPAEIDCLSHPETQLYRWVMIRDFEEGVFTNNPEAFEPKNDGISCFCNAHPGMTSKEAKRRAPHKAHKKPGILQVPSVQAQEIEGITGIEHTESPFGEEHVDIYGHFADVARLQSIQLDLVALATVVVGPGEDP